MGTLHIVLAMKPTQGNFANNALTFGVAGINIDGCRIGMTKNVPASPPRTRGTTLCGSIDGSLRLETGNEDGHNPNLGRFPANVILSHAEGCVLKGMRIVRGRKDEKPIRDEGRRDKTQWRFRPTSETSRGYADVEGKESVEDWECVENCPVKKLGEQSGDSGASGKASGPTCRKLGTRGIYGGAAGDDKSSPFYGDSGNASRFFYTVKELEIHDEDNSLRNE